MSINRRIWIEIIPRIVTSARSRKFNKIRRFWTRVERSSTRCVTFIDLWLSFWVRDGQLVGDYLSGTRVEIVCDGLSIPSSLKFELLSERKKQKKYHVVDRYNRTSKYPLYSIYISKLLSKQLASNLRNWEGKITNRKISNRKARKKFQRSSFESVIIKKKRGHATIRGTIRDWVIHAEAK